MNYAEPKLLLLVLGLLPLLLLWVQSERRYKRRLKLALPHLRWRSSSPFLLSCVLQALGFVCVIFALARPRWDFQWQESRKKGSDIVIALDVSRSMQANDLSPSRLELAKRAIKDVVAAAGGDRLGLVLFSGVAFVQCPLTSDRGSFELFLDQAQTDTIPVQGTSLADALHKAEVALQDGEEAGSQGKAILLLSDGEDHSGELDQVIAELTKKSIRVHAVGVAGSGAPIPVADGGFLRDEQGNIVVSRLEEGALRTIAEKTSGTYRRLEAGQDFEAVYKSEIRAGSADKESVSRERLWTERHMWLSGLAALCFLLDLALRRRLLVTPTDRLRA